MTISLGEQLVPAHRLNMWVNEVHQDVVCVSLRVEKVLFSGKSRYQQVDILQTAAHGRVLLNDGIMMLSERDEPYYHEMIAHVPLFVHPNPARVLIIGGGDGGTAREVLKHRNVKHVVMVEIDELVVEACRKYIPSVSCALDDPRLELVIDDGVKYVQETGLRFDVVIVDSTEPIGPAEPLFDSAFYGSVSGILSEHGIMITQAESPFYDHDMQRALFSHQRPFFKKLHMYLYPMLVYPGGMWSFGYASTGLCPVRDFKKEMAESCDFNTFYYNSDIHTAAFALPNFMRCDLEGIIDPV